MDHDSLAALLPPSCKLFAKYGANIRCLNCHLLERSKIILPRTVTR